MNGLDIFANLDQIHDNGFDSHHVADKGVSTEFQFRLDVLFLLRLQSLYGGTKLRITKFRIN
jgi:hypothetical protein